MVPAVVGALVLIIVIVIICKCCCRKKKTKEQSVGSSNDVAQPHGYVNNGPKPVIVQGVPVHANNGSAQNLHEYPELDPHYHNFGGASNQQYLANQQYYQQKGPVYSMNEYPEIEPNN